MTIREAIFSAWRLPLLGTLFLILTGQLFITIGAFRDGRSRRLKTFLLTPFLLGAAILWFCLSFISWEHNFPGGPLPAWLAAGGSLPARVLVLAELPLAILLILSLRDSFRYRKDHPTPDSVKETMDLLPVGVAFGQADGTVLLRNLVMEQLSRTLTGKPLTSLTAFRGLTVGEKKQAQVALEGRVWHMDVGETHAGGETLMQLTATDMTVQAGVTADLEAKNKKLRDIHLRLEIFHRQAERIIIAQEMLTARMTVHDELGHILLESRQYLNDPGAFQNVLFLQALKNTNASFLREYEQDGTARDALADAIELAKAIGVEVTMTGRVPTEESLRGTLAAAVQECAANTVKHAGGDALNVRISREENRVRITVKNNGTAPAEPIRESGGLLSLRQLVENRDGCMDIESVPAFRLTIILPDPPESTGD